ncbi:MAG: hypothetical protein JXC85_00560 [Candidatus Aenigmarchaeota archaeon]|nr:hypothetical protein [Candidatus Aenigmarchaeota archaeon]
MAENEPKSETITTTIEIEKDVFLKFKALCVLGETTLSKEIEKLIRKSVEDQAGKVEGIMTG